MYLKILMLTADIVKSVIEVPRQAKKQKIRENHSLKSTEQYYRRTVLICIRELFVNIEKRFSHKEECVSVIKTLLPVTWLKVLREAIQTQKVL